MSVFSLILLFDFSPVPDWEYSSPGFPSSPSTVCREPGKLSVRLAPAPVSTGGCSILRVFIYTFPPLLFLVFFFLLSPACTLSGWIWIDFGMQRLQCTAARSPHALKHKKYGGIEG